MKLGLKEIKAFELIYKGWPEKLLLNQIRKELVIMYKGEYYDMHTKIFKSKYRKRTAFAGTRDLLPCG
jgi:hypothetical protein